MFERRCKDRLPSLSLIVNAPLPVNDYSYGRCKALSFFKPFGPIRITY
jgi:hypothetical protein